MRIHLTPVTAYTTTLADGRTVVLMQDDTWAGMTRLRRVDAPDQALILDIEPPGFAGLFRSITDAASRAQEALVVKGSRELLEKLKPLVPTTQAEASTPTNAPEESRHG